MNSIVRILISDILKNKIAIAYTLMLAVLCWSSFALEDSSAKGLLTVLNVILFTVPLVSVLFTAIYIYNSTEFIEMLLSQPLKRRTIWLSLFAALASSLVFAFWLGAGIAILVNAPGTIGFMLIGTGTLITLVFTSLAFLVAISTRDKAKGIGISIMTWLFFALLFDGIVLFLLFQLSEYPIENAMVGLTAFSPIDLARIQILLQMEVSAMMGYTGAVFRNYFGTTVGLIVSFALLLLWAVVPLLLSLRKFSRNDL